MLLSLVEPEDAWPQMAHYREKGANRDTDQVTVLVLREDPYQRARSVGPGRAYGRHQPDSGAAHTTEGDGLMKFALRIDRFLRVESDRDMERRIELALGVSRRICVLAGPALRGRPQRPTGHVLKPLWRIAKHSQPIVGTLWPIADIPKGQRGVDQVCCHRSRFHPNNRDVDIGVHGKFPVQSCERRRVREVDAFARQRIEDVRGCQQKQRPCGRQQHAVSAQVGDSFATICDQRHRRPAVALNERLGRLSPINVERVTVHVPDYADEPNSATAERAAAAASLFTEGAA